MVEIKNLQALIDWLVETGRLSETEAQDRRRIAVAAGQALDDLPVYWRRKKELLTRQP
jgi:hypothetical protein